MIAIRQPDRERLIDSVAPLIHRLADRMYHAIVSLRENCELCDVRQRAMLATVEAASRHAPSCGAFAPFAYRAARGAILNLAGECGLVKIPRRLLAEKREEYAQVVPSDDVPTINPAERTGRRTPELEAAVQDWLRRLPKRQLLAVSLRFGLDRGEPLSLQEIGIQLGYEPAAATTGADYQIRRALATGRQCTALRDLFRYADHSS